MLGGILKQTSILLEGIWNCEDASDFQCTHLWVCLARIFLFFVFHDSHSLIWCSLVLICLMCPFQLCASDPSGSLLFQPFCSLAPRMFPTHLTLPILVLDSVTSSRSPGFFQERTILTHTHAHLRTLTLLFISRSVHTYWKWWVHNVLSIAIQHHKGECGFLSFCIFFSFPAFLTSLSDNKNFRSYYPKCICLFV